MKQSVGPPRGVVDEPIWLIQNNPPRCLSVQTQLHKTSNPLPAQNVAVPSHSQATDDGAFVRSLFCEQDDVLEFSKILPDLSFYSTLSSHNLSSVPMTSHSMDTPMTSWLSSPANSNSENYSESRFNWKPQNHLKLMSIKPNPWYLLSKISSVKSILHSLARDKACLLSHRQCTTVNREYSQVFLFLLVIFMSLAASSTSWISAAAL